MLSSAVAVLKIEEERNQLTEFYTQNKTGYTLSHYKSCTTEKTPETLLRITGSYRFRNLKSR